MREKLFTMRMSEEESLRLETVARHYGLNAAGVIRMLIKREHDVVGREKSPAPPAVAKKKPKK
jgi:predicted DNA-binding protein